MTRWISTFLGGLLVLTGSAQAALVTYSFSSITAGATAANVATGGAQLRLDVRDTWTDGTALASSQALFVFRNLGPNASSITDVYFDDGTLLSIAQVAPAGGGVDFSQIASPGNLPGGNTIGFETTAGFSADSNPPVQPNGVNPGEHLWVLFNLKAGTTFFNLIQALEGDLQDPIGVNALRVGLHVQSFANGDSASFVNQEGGAGSAEVLTPVPLPAALPLLLAGLLPMGVAARLRRKKVVRRALRLREGGRAANGW